MRHVCFLAAFLASIVISTWTSPAHGELSRTDKLSALYSNQFSFDRRNMPLISIAIAEQLKRVTITSEAAIRVLPDGEGGAQIIGGRQWQVRLLRGKPAKVEYFVLLASTDAHDTASIQQSAAKWQSLVSNIEVLEVGSVFGVKGHVFDNRRLMVVEGPFPTEEKAEHRAKKHVRDGHLADGVVIRQLKQRPSGQIEVTDQQNKTRILVDDAIWFMVDRPTALLSVHDREGTKRKYRGQIYIAVDQFGKLALVNLLPIDELLAGLVSAEIFPSAPDAALQAQAVAARGNLLAKIGQQSLADPYLTCAWVRCQVYRGAGYERARTTAAINKTRGLVIVHRGTRAIVNAVYHAHSGGHTESNEFVWFGKPDAALRGRLDAPLGVLKPFSGGITEANIEQWLAIRPDSWSARSGVNTKRLRWRVERSAAQISQDAKSLRVGPVTNIRVLKRGVSGRAYLIEVEGALGRAEVKGELRIRRLFGNLPSSMFVVKRLDIQQGRPGRFVFVGGGWGHGSGMCQSGAIGMSKAGKSFSEILKHYYSDSEIRAVY